MREHENTQTRPPLESLACVDHRCELYGHKGQGNLTVRKVYGKDAIRFVRCQRFQSSDVRISRYAAHRAALVDADYCDAERAVDDHNPHATTRPIER